MLGDKSNIVADVLTTDREEYVLHMDGRGGGAFSGPVLETRPQSQSQGQAPDTHVPFEHLALVYYLDEPVGGPHTPARPVKGKYPLLATAGPAEPLDCRAPTKQSTKEGCQPNRWAWPCGQAQTPLLQRPS